MSASARSKLQVVWGNSKDLSQYDKNFLNTTQYPFVVIKEADINSLPHFFVAPGVECYECHSETIQKVNSTQEIVNFANKFANGEFIPNFLMNENLTLSLSQNARERIFF